MNPDGDDATALQAAIAAGRLAAIPASRCMPPNNEGGVNFGSLDPAALGLLWRVRNSLAGSAPGVVQFVPCGRGCAQLGGASTVALGFACAAAAVWGRTLLLVAGGAETVGILPDAFVPRLYHQGLGSAALYAMLSRPGSAAGPGGSMFDAVVVDQAAPDAGDCAAALARLCAGTVLVVQAGRSDLASIKGAVGRIGTMGGAVLGTVLADAPAWVRTS